MSDQPPPGPVLPPEQSDAVSRLLREARVETPMPEDVRHRLDGVIGDLAAQRAARTRSVRPLPPRPGAIEAPAHGAAGSESNGPVVDLAARRRRTRLNLVVAAAAAVVAVGVGAATIPPLIGGDTTANDSSESAPEPSAGGGSLDGLDAEGSQESPGSDGHDDGALPSDAPEHESLPAPGRGASLSDFDGEFLDGQDAELALDSLAQDAQSLVDGAVAAGEVTGPSTCEVTLTDGEVGVVTTYEGTPAVLAVMVDSGWARVLTCEGALLAGTSVSVD